MHIPVLKEKVLEYLNPQKNDHFIDCTLGNGGHTFALLERTAPKGKILALEQDPDAIARVKAQSATSKMKNRLVLVQENFVHVKEVAQKEKFKPVKGILFDLGLSSEQLQESNRGLSFQKKEPLDMRYNPKNPLLAEKIVNYWSRQDLERILKEYGEEQFASEIAQAIVETRTTKGQIIKTNQLVDIILQATPKWYHKKKINPATKTFQALRIAVNNELQNLKEALPQSLEILEPEGKLAVISFHSLEDRIVKNFINNNTSLKPLTKKAIIASFEEQKRNPRSRSAKLRVGIKVTAQP